MKDDNCIFCKLANGDIPTNSIYEDDDFKVIQGRKTMRHRRYFIDYLMR